MEDFLHQRVIGQDQAIEVLSGAIRRSRSGLSDPNRPIGSFLFIGPTGVGKTEMARTLAEFLFDDERAMIRIDMSEYQESHTVARTEHRLCNRVGYLPLYNPPQWPRSKDRIVTPLGQSVLCLICDVQLESPLRQSL